MEGWKGFQFLIFYEKKENSFTVKMIKGLTVFAFALLDKRLVFDVLVTSFAVKPGPDKPR